MQTIECMKSRRSRRLFLDKEIPQEIIDNLIECALSAPSSMNCQPWHFVVVKDRTKKEALAKLKTERNQQHILTAPISILVCVDQTKCSTHFFEDAVTATQNILLAAHELNLGAVYVTGCSESQPEVTKTLREILLLPDHILPVTILPVGYPDPTEQMHKKVLLEPKDVVHVDQW